MKRVLSFVLVIALLAITIPFQAVSVSAAVSAPSSYAVVENRMSAIVSGKYGVEKYFRNDQNKACCFPNGVSCHGKHDSNGFDYKTDSFCNCKVATADIAGTAGGIQCFGYARYVFYQLFGLPISTTQNSSTLGSEQNVVKVGQHITTSQAVTSEKVASIFAAAKMGDFIQARSGSSYGSHSMIVHTVTSSYVLVLDCNFDGDCRVQLRKLDWEKFASSYKWFTVYRAKNHPGGTPTPIVHNVDSAYDKNLTAYPKVKITNENIFDEYHLPVGKNCWIGTADKCTILEVYKDGCCKVTYPLDSGGTKTVYSKIALFDIGDGPHTCDKGQYMYYEAAHPHYSCYKCSVCGTVWRNTAETNVVSSCSSCDTASCTCSTSYAGTYTTKNVSSELRIRDAHSTNGNVVGYIPAYATFTVSKANGSWAHVTYNGKSGYVSQGYIQEVKPSIIDTRYPTPFKAYTLQNAKQPAYDAVNGNNIGNIYTSDFVTIEAVYTNGWVKATCPWTGYSNGRTIYAPLSTFLNASYTPKTVKATTKTQCYYRSDLSSSPGYVYVGDTCVQVGESGNYVCVLCPWNTGGYYLVWSNKSAFAHTHSYDSWSKYDGSYHSRNCACGNVEKQAHTWNSGTVTKEATCTASGVKTYTCTACKATKTETIAVKDHTWDNGTVKVAATCGDNGVRTYKCSGCGGTFDQVIPATGKHAYDNDCDNICNVCEDMRIIQGHTYSSVITTAATCGKDGVMTYTCSICSRSYTEEIPATENHTYDDEYDADCNVCGGVREVPEKPPVTPDLPADAPAFVVDSVSASAGKEVIVAIRTERNSGIVSLKLGVSYDTAVLELIDAEGKDFEGTSFGPITNVPFVVNWFDALSPNNTTDGVVVLLTFRVKEDASLGKTDITLSYDAVDVFDQHFNDVAFRTVNGYVEVVEYTIGDVNNDDNINNRDLALLQQYLNGWEVTVNEAACDVYADGNVNNRDLALLQQYLNGWDVTLG